MTEREWLAGKGSRRMLEFVRDTSSTRKLRLFVCGCLRAYLPQRDDKLSRAALEMSEAFADGFATVEEV